MMSAWGTKPSFRLYFSSRSGLCRAKHGAQHTAHNTQQQSTRHVQCTVPLTPSVFESTRLEQQEAEASAYAHSLKSLMLVMVLPMLPHLPLIVTLPNSVPYGARPAKAESSVVLPHPVCEP